MSKKFLKPHIYRPGILDPKPGDPNGYVTNDGMWAAVPIIGSKKFAIINFGSVVHTANNYKTAVSYIEKAMKGKSVSTLDKFI